MTPSEFYAKDIPFVARVDTCLRGHEYNESNSRYIVREDGSAGRYCLPCRRLYDTWNREVTRVADEAKLEVQRQLVRA